MFNVSHLLPVFLQGRHRREIASVVDELKFLKNTVIRQHVHVDAKFSKENPTTKKSNIYIYDGTRQEKKRSPNKKKKKKNPPPE